MFNPDISVRRTSTGSIDHDFYRRKAKEERGVYVLGGLSSTGRRLRSARSSLVVFALGVVVGAGALGGFTRHPGLTSANSVSISPYDLTLSAAPLRTADHADTH